MRNRLASQRGQSTVEWGALIVLVGLVITALMTAGIPQAAAKGVVCGVRQALGGQNAGCSASGVGGSGTGSAPGTSGDPWNSTNPVTRATWGTYVSLGDSYSAGEGLGDYEQGSSVHQSQCKVSVLGHCVYHKDPKIIDGCDRSAKAYNGTVSGTYTFKGGKRTWACSGSITKDIYDPASPACSHGHASGRYGEGCQANRVNASTSLVTLSIGGNDAGFADDLSSCYKNRIKLAWSKSCSYQQSAIDQKITGIAPNLIADLKALRARSPHARIILMTYPKLFPDPPTGNAGCVLAHICLTKGDQAFYNREAVKLDNAICAAAARAGVGAECINAANAFSGCEMGQANSCLQNPHTHISGSTGIGTNPGAFHPTPRGQQILGELVDHEIQDPPPGTGPD
jgi:hypothetical protein